MFKYFLVLPVLFFSLFQSVDASQPPLANPAEIFFDFSQAVDNPNTPHDESEFGNPAIMAVGPDGKLYIGLFGDFFPNTNVRKGIGRISIDENGNKIFEVVVRFPDEAAGGIVEKLLFNEDGDLYVNVSNYPTTTPDFSINPTNLNNGIVKVDVVNKTYQQFWVEPIDPNQSFQQLTGGLAIDGDGNFYVADATYGVIYKVDSQGNGGLWLDHPLLKGDGSVTGFFPVGANGIVFNKKERALYVANFEKGSLIKIPALPGGAAGEPSVLVEDPSLISFDDLKLSPNEKAIFTGTAGTGRVIQFDLTTSPPTVYFLTETSDGLGDTVQALPTVGFGSAIKKGLFVPMLDSGNIGGGIIWLLTPQCDPPNSNCSFW